MTNGLDGSRSESLLNGAALRCDDVRKATLEVIAHPFEVLLVEGFPCLIGGSLHDVHAGVWQGAHPLDQVTPEGVVLK